MDLAHFKELYITTIPQLLRLSRRMVGNEFAEDIVHDAFLRYYERYRWITDPAAASRILHRIVYTLCIDQLRDAAVKRDAYAGVMAEEMAEINHFPTDDEDTSRLTRLKKAIENITQHKQMILLMRYTEGLSAKQIAAQLGLSVRTVENTIFRCIVSLRNEMNSRGNTSGRDTDD